MSQAEAQTGKPIPLLHVVDALRREGRLTAAAAARATTLLAELDATQPWYVRAMVAFGAWLASLLLISFAAGLGLALGGLALVGAASIGVAIWARRHFDNDFVAQATLATSLAGQALFAAGMADVLPGDDLRTFCIVVILVSGVVFALTPDRILRTLCVPISASALATLIYQLELNALIPVLGPLFAFKLVLLDEHRGRLIALGYGASLRPLQTGLMLSAFGMLMLSTVYLLPEFYVDVVFYPRPWISTLLLGALLLYVMRGVVPQLFAGAHAAAKPLTYALALLIIVAAWAAPGILLALTVALRGMTTGNRTFTAAGVGFLAVFLGAYFYGIEITMLAKSITLIATGTTLLLLRNVLMTVLADHDGGVTVGERR
jgi:hypothetical protein